MAKKTVAAKKRNVKVDAYGQAHIHSSFNNIIVSLANSEGQVISWSSAGKMGFRSSKKNTPYAAQVAAADAAKTAYDLGLRKVKAYVDRLYDTASARLDTPELQEFLHYPDADFDEVARELCVDYYTENVAGAPMAKGERINPMTYDEALNVIPPKRAPAELLRAHGCTEGFLMGEPAGIGPGGRSLYHAYGRDAKGNCYYLGLSPEAGASASRQAKSRASPPRQASRSLRTKPKAGTRTSKPRSKSKGVRR